MAFVLASFGPKVCAQLAADSSCLSVFPGKTGRALMDAFLDKVYPVAPGHARKPEVARWLCRQYLEHRHNGQPVLAEDLYKIGEDVSYFNDVKKSSAFHASGMPTDILRYKTLASFQEALGPFREKKSLRAASARWRRMDADARARITAESTVLYKGPEGTVVIPHTPAASRYWGNNTRWCISGNEAEKFFARHVQRSPVIMFLPSGPAAEKAALVQHVWYDSADKKLAGAAPRAGLIAACRAGLSPEAARGFDFWTAPPAAPDLAVQRKIAENIRSFLCGNPAAPWSDRAFLLEALRQSSDAMLWMSSQLSQDPGFLRDAVCANAEVLWIMGDTLAAPEGKSFLESCLAQSDTLAFLLNDVKTGKCPEIAPEALKGFQTQALERLAARGEPHKVAHYARALWGDREAVLGAKTAESLVKMRAARPTASSSVSPAAKAG
jgi:hypothetical protein